MAANETLNDWCERLPVAALIVDESNQILRGNATLRSLLDYSGDELDGAPLNKLLARSGRLFYLTHIMPMLQQQALVEEMYLRLQAKSGTDIPVLLNAERHRIDGKVLYFFAMMPIQRRYIFEDQLVQAKEQAEQALAAERAALQALELAQNELHEKQAQLLKLNDKLKELAATDPLTRIANRRTFEEKIEHFLALYRRESMCFSLLTFDLDHFKAINDKFGHDAGDKVLIAVANLLQESLREVDVAARIGGEEFAVILAGTSLNEAEHTAERLRQSITKLHFEELAVTTSIGVTSVCRNDSRQQLLTRADKALYMAKARARNCVHVLTD